VIVADASAVADVLLARPGAERIRDVLACHTEVHVPEHFYVEVLSALRRHGIHGELGELRAAEALTGLDELRVIPYPVRALMDDIWSVRHELTVYDAAYLALARRLDVELASTDGALAGAAAADGRLAAGL